VFRPCRCGRLGNLGTVGRICRVVRPNRNRHAPAESFSGGVRKPIRHGMSAHRIALAATMALIAASGGAVVLPASAAAASTVMVPALGVDGGLVGPQVTVAEGSFPGGARVVVATISARHAATSTRRPTMLSVKLVCGNEAVQATTNIVSGAVLAPRRLMQDPTDCRVIANSAVYQAVPGDGLAVTSRLTSQRVRWGAVGYKPDGWPSLVRAGHAYDAVPVTLTVPARISRVQITGDMKVTTCTSVGGSRENGSPYLCNKRRLNPKGSTVIVRMVVTQKRTDGTACVQRTLSSRTVHVDFKAHHAMIAQQGSYVLSRAAGCTRQVKVKLYTKAVSGADVIVHRRGTITNIYG
jgi:hypothetical protein